MRATNSRTSVNVPVAADALQTAKIAIAASPGQISVCYPELFSLTAQQHLRRFVERVFGLGEICSLSVQFARGTAFLNFDSRSTSVSALLKKLAHVLSDDPANVPRGQYVSVDATGRRRLRKVNRFQRLGTDWLVLQQLPGELRVSNGQFSGQSFLQNVIASAVEEHEFVRSARIEPAGCGLLISYDAECLSPDGVRGLLDEATDKVNECYWAQFQAAQNKPLVGGITRTLYMALTVGSFAMSIIALIAPGIPTPPFLIATTYFGIQSSPRFYGWLRRSWLFGRMIRDWRSHRALRFSDKVKSILITLVLVGIGIFALGLSGPLLLAVLVLAAIEVTVMLLLPQIDSPRKTGRWGYLPHEPRIPHGNNSAVRLRIS